MERKVILKKPLVAVEGQAPITVINLREPVARDLIGFNLMKIYTQDTEEILSFINRISSPPIPRKLAENLSLYDLANIGSTITSFFIDESDILESATEILEALKAETGGEVEPEATTVKAEEGTSP